MPQNGKPRLSLLIRTGLNKKVSQLHFAERAKEPQAKSFCGLALVQF